MSAEMHPEATWSWYETDDERSTIFWICVGLNAMFVLSAVVLLSGVEAPYGRYNQNDGKEKNPVMAIITSLNVPSKVAWFIQESPTLFWPTWCWLFANPACKYEWGNIVVLGCFVVHYVNRTIVFPLRSRGSKPIPLPVMLMAFAFCACNGYIQCRTLLSYTTVPLLSVSTLTGVAIWALGFYLNMDADDILRNLRKPGETEYKIPRGGLFDYVSGANFAAEILEWVGFFIASGLSLPAFTFAFCTACNIGPRAVQHHNWYLQKFKDTYPQDRKALIPLLW